LPRGNKLRMGLTIPQWILKDPSYSVACVRGLMDTDGCLYVHRHTTLGSQYRNIGLCFTSLSTDLTRQVAGIFRIHGIEPHMTARDTRIYLYSVQAVERYLRVFGTSNSRISGLYESWKQSKAPDLRFRQVVV
jgi:intein/homing endonuclease